ERHQTATEPEMVVEETLVLERGQEPAAEDLATNQVRMSLAHPLRACPGRQDCERGRRGQYGHYTCTSERVGRRMATATKTTADFVGWDRFQRTHGGLRGGISPTCNRRRRHSGEVTETPALAPVRLNVVQHAS